MHKKEYFNICKEHVHINDDYASIEVDDELMVMMFEDEELFRYYILKFMPMCIEGCIR